MLFPINHFLIPNARILGHKLTDQFGHLKLQVPFVQTGGLWKLEPDGLQKMKGSFRLNSAKSSTIYQQTVTQWLIMKLKEVRSLSSSFPTGTFHERNYILRQEQLTSYDGNTKYSVKCLLLKSTAKQVKIQFLTFSSHTENYMWRDTCSVTLVLTLETVTSYTYDILGDIHSLKLQHFTEGHVLSSYHCESQHSQS